MGPVVRPLEPPSFRPTVRRQRVTRVPVPSRLPCLLRKRQLIALPVGLLSALLPRDPVPRLVHRVVSPQEPGRRVAGEGEKPVVPVQQQVLVRFVFLVVPTAVVLRARHPT